MASDLMNDGTASRTERAAQRLGALAHRVPRGARLGTKAELRELCGVSVGTFNEALRVAQARGLVVVRPGPGGGLFAADQSPMVRLGNSVLALNADPAPVADAVRIRDALDPLVIADAAWHSSPADIAEFRRQVTVMADALEAGDATAFIQANWRLHELLTAVNPSPMLRSIYQTLIEIIRDHTLKVLPTDGQPLSEAMAERHRIHAELVEAIAKQDADAIDRLTKEHSGKGP